MEASAWEIHVPGTPKDRRGLGADPEYRRARSRKAGAEAHSSDTLIRRLVERAPELTEDQRSKLAALLKADA